ncbi:MAG: hypothetical protein FJZ88_00850 [Chloroflexi bacterium]|nr:hypothetical protein [Chloroflexota bacterium]
MSMAKGVIGPEGGGAGVRVTVGVGIGVAFGAVVGVVVGVGGVNVRTNMPREVCMDAKSRQVRPKIIRPSKPKRAIR